MISRRGVLGGVMAGAAGSLLIPAGTASAAPNRPVTTFPTLRLGSTGLNVRALRYLLHWRGHKVGIANIYDTATYNGVRAFQKRRGLVQDGVCGHKTFTVLIGDIPPIKYLDTSYATCAAQVLLLKHEYHATIVPSFGPVTLRNMNSFQVGHALPKSTALSLTCWSTLFGALTSGPMFSVLQRDTGTAQWANCGPAAAVSLLLNRGIMPAAWTGYTSERRAAVEYMRYTSMEVPRNAERDKKGTEFPDFVPAFADYGLALRKGGIDATLADARNGRPSIAGGDVFQMPYPVSTSGPVSHWVAVLGYDGTYYLVSDSLSRPEADYIHRLTEAQLRKYAATNPGHPPETAKENSILLA